MKKSLDFGFLSNNTLKIIAAVAMVCDHVGMFLFPNLLFLRIIGRTSFPIFAYLLAEGAKHTKNKARHLIVFASFALTVQSVYFIFDQSPKMSVLVTFTLSLLMIYALDAFKAAIFALKPSKRKIALTSALFIGSVALAVTCDALLDLDYGLAGAMLPLFPAIFTTPKSDGVPSAFRKLDNKALRVAATALGITFLSFRNSIQIYALLAIPLLLLYSEKRGKLNMKYFFYLFYPLHLVIIYAIAILIKRFS